MTANKIEAIPATGWQSALHAAAVPTLAGGAVMAASLANFLNHNQYPLLRPEIGAVAALLLLAVLLMGLLYAASGRIVRTILQIALVCLALDLNFDGYVVPIAAVGIAIALQGRAMPFLAVAASVVLLTVLAGMATAERVSNLPAPVVAGERQTNLPVLVHLVLDEHIGVEGLPDDLPDAVEMRRALQRLYIGHGFHLFGGAYSEHIRTVNAIPQLLNFSEPHSVTRDENHSSLVSNRYFDRLGAAGYRIHVTQTDYMDYCTNKFVIRCDTRRAADLAGIADAPLSTEEKAYIVATEFSKLSAALTLPAALYHRAFRPSQTVVLPPLGPLTDLDRLAGSLSTAKPGDAFFVHVLLPHSPYALNEDCSLRVLADWKDQWNGPKRERVLGYLRQLTCLNGKLEALFEAAAPDAIVIVQGDHGYRIADVEPSAETLGAFSERDLIAGHSTLFAIRAPDVSPGYDTRPLPGWEILRQFALSDFRSAAVSLAPDFTPSIMLGDRDWVPVKRYPLPEGWPAGPATH